MRMLRKKKDYPITKTKMKPEKNTSDLWRMDLKQLKALVGRAPSSVEIHNKHVVCLFPGFSSVEKDGSGNTRTTIGADTRVRFRQW